LKEGKRREKEERMTIEVRKKIFRRRSGGQVARRDPDKRAF